MMRIAFLYIFSIILCIILLPIKYRKNTGKITHIIIGILNQSSLCTLNLNSTLPAYRTNFAEVAGTTYKVAKDCLRQISVL